MLEQTFTPVALKLIITNIEYVKHELSKVESFDATEYLDEVKNIVEHTDMLQISP